MERATAAPTATILRFDGNQDDNSFCKQRDEPAVDPSALEKPSQLQMSHEIASLRTDVTELKLAIAEILQTVRSIKSS